MTEPHLIVVAGPPAAGKTALAHRIAGALRLPLICKDTIKEALYDHLGVGDRAWSQQLGYAIVQCMYALAGDILCAGASIVIESTFIHRDTPGELQALLDQTGARLSVVYCYATPEVLNERFNARAAAERHRGHQDPATTTPETFAGGDHLSRPDYPGRFIPVDTTDFGAVSLVDILGQLGRAPTG
jgi:predicted kinase